jgi:hypothetical protein
MSDSVSVVTVLVSAGLSVATGYVSSRVSHRLQDRQTAHRWRLAIISEIRTLRGRLAQYETAYETLVVTGEIPGAQVLRVLLQPGDISVFTNSAASIGLFDTRISLRVLRFYADIRALQGHALVLAEIAGGSGRSASDADIQQHRTRLRRCRLRANVLIRRLRVDVDTIEVMRRMWSRARRWAIAPATLPRAGDVAAVSNADNARVEGRRRRG